MKTKTFTDFDEFSQTIRDVDAVMTLQNPEQHLWSVKQFDLGGIDLQFGQLGSGNMVEGQSWQVGFIVYIPLSKACEYRINGSGFISKEFMLLEPGTEFCLSTKASHDWFTVFVPIEECSSGSDFPWSTSGPQTSKIPRAYVYRERYETQTRLRSLVTEIFTASANSNQFEHSPAAEFAKAKLLDVLTSVVGGKRANKNDPTGRAKGSRMQIIRRCKDFAQAHVGESISVVDMASAANVSERTLRSVFKEYFGIPPTKYLQLRRLHQVRTALKDADPTDTKVTDIVFQYGEWELGRFASRYKQIFGELPYQTLLSGRK